MKGICRLCLADTDIKDSHLLPRALYRHIRKKTGSEAVRVTPTQITQHSKQVSDYLLCASCEDKFSKRGEKWVSENYPQNNGNFPLQEALLQAAPKKEIGGDKYYKAASVSGLDAQKISYFAISVFWRAAAHKWSFLDHDQKLNFGCYEEKLRLFLLDQGLFPDEAALHIVVSPRVK